MYVENLLGRDNLLRSELVLLIRVARLVERHAD